MLKAAAESGNLGAFKVNGSSIVATEDNGFKSPPTTIRPTPGRGRGYSGILVTDFPFLTMSSRRGFSSPHLTLKICCIPNAILKEIPSLC